MQVGQNASHSLKRIARKRKKAAMRHFRPGIEMLVEIPHPRAENAAVLAEHVLDGLHSTVPFLEGMLVLRVLASATPAWPGMSHVVQKG